MLEPRRTPTGRSTLPVKLKLNGIADSDAAGDRRPCPGGRRAGPPRARRRRRRRPSCRRGCSPSRSSRSRRRCDRPWPRAAPPASARRRRPARPCRGGRASRSWLVGALRLLVAGEREARLLDLGLLGRDVGVELGDLLALGREDEEVEGGDGGAERDAPTAGSCSSGSLGCPSLGRRGGRGGVVALGTLGGVVTPPACACGLGRGGRAPGARRGAVPRGSAGR